MIQCLSSYKNGLGCFVKSFVLIHLCMLISNTAVNFARQYTELVDNWRSRFGCLGLQINIKSGCIRVGNNFRNTYLCIFVNGVP